MHPEHQYLNTLKDILTDGVYVPNRTGVNTLRILGVTHRYDFKYGFPLFTTKRVYWHGVLHELLWFLNGDPNIKYLVDNNVSIWNDDAYRFYFSKLKGSNEELLNKEEFIANIKKGQLDTDLEGYKLGDLGPVYGAQWRQWESGGQPIDQVQNLINSLKSNPSSRRHIISAWNVAEISEMALPPCHLLSQFTINDGKLWCHMYQRSCDMFLGVPFNVASYSLLTHMVAKLIGVKPGGFIHTMHDTHIYMNHIDAVAEQVIRVPKKFPELIFTEIVNEHTSIDDFSADDIVLSGYDPHPRIKAPLNT